MANNTQVVAAAAGTQVPTGVQVQPDANAAPRPSVLLRLAGQFGVDWKELYNTLTKTCFRKEDGSAPTKEEMMSLLIISEQAGLNPLVGEIYAFPGKAGGIVPIVGINGWRKIASANPEYAGIRFEFSQERIEVCGVRCCEFVKCVVTRRRKDGSSYDAEGYAFFDEKFRPTAPWKQQPRQMLMNKAQIQALKNAFPGLSSLYDEDEGKDVSTASVPASTVTPVAPAPKQWRREELAACLKKVVALAEARRQWAQATEWVLKNTHGADQEFALEFLAKARRTDPVQAEDVPAQPAAPAQAPLPAAPAVPVKEVKSEPFLEDDPF